MSQKKKQNKSKQLTAVVPSKDRVLRTKPG
jgi:hypothetical protein